MAPRTAAAVRFALAHHPLCSTHRTHVVLLAGRPFCAGCVAFFPALLAAAPVAAWLAVLFPWWHVLGAGAALATVQFLSLLQAVRRPWAKAVVKVAVGCAAALVVAGTWAAPWPVAGRLATMLALMAIAGAVQLLRLRGLRRTCEACPWAKDWARCPGFAPFNDHVPGSRPAGPGSHPEAWPWSK